MKVVITKPAQKDLAKLNKEIRQRVRILLLTDGMANVGITDHQALILKANQIARSGVQVSTFGLGVDFEEDFVTANGGSR